MFLSLSRVVVLFFMFVAALHRNASSPPRRNRVAPRPASFVAALPLCVVVRPSFSSSEVCMILLFCLSSLVLPLLFVTATSCVQPLLLWLTMLAGEDSKTPTSLCSSVLRSSCEK
ncbi:hypothetical protein BVRB_005930, partial [Beta vulgaris subsp. vulgaris]